MEGRGGGCFARRSRRTVSYVTLQGQRFARRRFLNPGKVCAFCAFLRLTFRPPPVLGFRQRLRYLRFLLCRIWPRRSCGEGHTKRECRPVGTLQIFSRGFGIEGKAGPIYNLYFILYNSPRPPVGDCDTWLRLCKHVGCAAISRIWRENGDGKRAGREGGGVESRALGGECGFICVAAGGREMACL